MRRIVDTLAVGSCVVAAALFAVQQTRSESARQLVTETELDLDRFHAVLRLQAATPGVATNGRGWPTTIEPSWFSGDPPRNYLLTGDRPWVDVAPIEDAEREHPRDPVAVDADGDREASFWYNPYRGIIRARVAPRINDRQTLRLYNSLNGVALASLSPEHLGRTSDDQADEAQRLRDMADRVEQMARSAGAIPSQGALIRVRRTDEPVTASGESTSTPSTAANDRAPDDEDSAGGAAGDSAADAPADPPTA